LFHKVLVANRGEIAVRVIRTLQEMEIASVAIYSDADRGAHHVRLADEAVRIGPASSAESYLVVDRILDAARRTGADAVHPGYGFLSENAGFAEACEKAGLVFIGPPSSVIAALGDKLQARATAERAGAPVVPGMGPLPPHDDDAAATAAAEVGYPVMLKAAGGGGGKGMRVCRNEAELRSAIDLTRGEAQSAFSNPTLYLERFVERPRHVEVQILADQAGTTLWLGERDCSVQRRHQKLIEETPSPAVDPDLRHRMGETAVAICREAGYVGAGTVEFLLAPNREFYFLEVNARLQVEHPVTEWATGLDLVRAQIAIAAGEAISTPQEAIVRRGWAMECRITAEDPATGFLPCTGRVDDLRLPEGPFVRSDFGVLRGSEVSVHYDPMIGKITAWGDSREQARLRLLRAVRQFRLSGVVTNQHFHVWALQHPAFVSGDFTTAFIDEHWRPEELGHGRGSQIRMALVAAAIRAHDDRQKQRAPREGAAPSQWRLGGRRWR
jgi:acetyl-CoA carboxylase biotin carboxylase subunit